MKYRKKPIVINAWLIGPLLEYAKNSWKYLPEEVRHGYEAGKFIFTPSAIVIKTLEGTMTGSGEDYLVQGVKGEFYPCKPDIFEMNHESAE